MGAHKRRAMPDIRTVTMIAFAAIALAAFARTAAHAQSSDWVDTGGGLIRVVIEPPEAGAETVRGFLDIALAPGWKTYWRDPGSSGIPPQIDVTGSAGLANAQLHFPAPVWIDNPYGDFAGYDAPVALPFTMTRTANGPAHLDAQVFLGICEDICIPAQARFSLAVPIATGTTLEALEVGQAHAALPPAPVDGFALSASPAPPAGSSYVTVDHHAAPDAPPELFVYQPDGIQFRPPRIAWSADGQTRFRLDPTRPSDAQGTFEVIVTATQGEHQFETRHMLEIGAAE